MTDGFNGIADLISYDRIIIFNKIIDKKNLTRPFV